MRLKSTRCSAEPKRTGPVGSGARAPEFSRSSRRVIGSSSEVTETPKYDAVARDQLFRDRIGKRGELSAIVVAWRGARIRRGRWMRVNFRQTGRQVLEDAAHSVCSHRT